MRLRIAAVVVVAVLALSLGVSTRGGVERARAVPTPEALAVGFSEVLRGFELPALRTPWRWVGSWRYLGPRMIRTARLTGTWLGLKVDRVMARTAYETRMSREEAKEVGCIWLDFYLEEGNPLPSLSNFEYWFYDYIEDRLYPWTEYSELQGSIEKLYYSIVEGEEVSIAAADLTVDLIC